MDQLTFARVVPGCIQEQKTAALLANQRPTPGRYRAAYQPCQSALRGEIYPFDFTADTLQKRLSGYLGIECGLADAADPGDVVMAFVRVATENFLVPQREFPLATLALICEPRLHARMSYEVETLLRFELEVEPTRIGPIGLALFRIERGVPPSWPRVSATRAVSYDGPHHA